jgi:predicted DNA-binding WGR domain protein
MTGSMHLRRIDPDRNMARFYTVSVQPTLFGEWALLREWGRIGSAGRLVQRRFASEQEAALAMTAHLKARLSHGYAELFSFQTRKLKSSQKPTERVTGVRVATEQNY